MAAVLHVEPDEGSASVVADEPTAAGLSSVHRAQTVAEALSAFQKRSVDCVISE